MIRGLITGAGLALALTFACAGCDLDSEADDSASGDSAVGGSATVSGEKKEAQDAVVAEVQKHWTKTADGWVTARDSGTSFAPIRFLRQVRDIGVQGVEAYDLTDSDRMNGLEWAGEVTFKQTPCREVGEIGVVLDGLAMPQVMRQKGQWSQWIDFQPEPVKVHKRNGRWEVPTDTWMLRGAAPTDQDFADAGVSR